LGKALAKNKKGAAGKFPELLAQALKSLTHKAEDSSKVHTADRSEGALKPSRLSPGVEASRKTRLASLSAAMPRGHEGEIKAEGGTLSASGLLASGKTRAELGESSLHAAEPARERRVAARTRGPGDAEPRPASPADEKRLLKDRRPSGGEEAALLASLAAGESPKAKAPAPQPAKPKSASDAIEEGPALARQGGQGAAEPRLSVLDLRRGVESRRAAAAKADAKGEGRMEEIGREPAKEARAPGSETGREIYRELSLDTRGSGDAGQAPSTGKAEGGRGPDFQAMMADRMRESWNSEIVQSAHIVLRDGDKGTIRLRLRPESLGNVKIELNLSENNISGKIVVESDEAKNAFEKNMSQLADAFRQGGFDSARLEVSVGGSGQGALGGGRGGEASPQPFFTERLRGAAIAAEGATAASAYTRRGRAVDILA